MDGQMGTSECMRNEAMEADGLDSQSATQRSLLHSLTTAAPLQGVAADQPTSFSKPSPGVSTVGSLMARVQRLYLIRTLAGFTSRSVGGVDGAAAAGPEPTAAVSSLGPTGSVGDLSGPAAAAATTAAACDQRRPSVSCPASPPESRRRRHCHSYFTPSVFGDYKDQCDACGVNSCRTQSKEMRELNLLAPISF